jgi:DNA polymerase III alpha subunit (gram-positive type)
MVVWRAAARFVPLRRLARSVLLGPSPPGGDQICFIDLETSGLSSETGRIVEVACIRTTMAGDAALGRFQKLIASGVWLSPDFTLLTGITSAIVAAEGCSPRIVMEELLRFVGSSTGGEF